MDQYIRKCSILITSSTGAGIDVSDLHCKFTIKKSYVPTPNAGEIRIYNMTQDTAQQIKKEFKRVIVQAGYQSNYGLIFDGNIKQAKLGREGGTNTFVDVAAGDGDKACNFAVVNTTLAPGATPGSIISAAAVPMAAQGVTLGAGAGNLSGQALPRSRVMYGASRDYLRQATNTAGGSWSIQDGVVQVRSANALPIGTAIALSPVSGLVGSPEETNDGIAIKCLLNPLLKVHGQVALQDTYLDGFYRILALTFTGDTRGNDWYCDIVGKRIK